jgi:hypothetical protein
MHGVVVVKKETNGFVRIVLLSHLQRRPQRMRENDSVKLVSGAGSQELREWASAICRHGDTKTITHGAQALNDGVKKARVAIIIESHHIELAMWNEFRGCGL